MLTRLAVAAVGLALATATHADPFLSANLARTTTKYDDVKVGTGYSLAAGYSFDSLAFPVFIEGSLYDSGKLKVKDSGGIKLKYDGFQGFGGVALKLGNTGSRLWGKAGYYVLDGKISSGDASASEKSNGITLGLGGDWMFAGSVGARFEIETPFKVKSIPGLGSDEKTQLSIIKVGLVWRPKISGAATPSVASPVAAEPVQQAVYQMPVAAPSTAGKTQMVVPLAIGGTASVAAGTVIKGQPKPDSAAAATVAAMTSVTLGGSSSNASGQWWYVQGPGVQGWVQASELVSP